MEKSGSSSPVPASNKRRRRVDEELAALDEMTYAGLRDAWTRWFKKQPPPRLSRNLLTLGVAWKIQEKAYGGLSAATKRRLRVLADHSIGDSKSTRPAATALRSGMRLVRVREWHGTVHTVCVTETGFEWRDRSWRSLTAIAREITGQRWSGPRFFGLTKTPRAAAKRVSESEVGERTNAAPAR
jgi:hypothetical protein